MAKRDHVQEILEIQARTGERPPYIGVTLRIQEIRSLIDGYDSPPEEALRYCPVGLVACVEAYFRAVIKELIDAGEPFLGRSEALERRVFNFQVVAAIHGRTITLGDLVAHLIPLNNKQNINSAMSALLDTDFLEQLKEVRGHWPWKPVASAPAEAVISEPAIVFADLDKVFELRHIVCHEFASPIHITLHEVEKYINSVTTFLDATNFIVMKLLFKDIPDTQQERNVYFGKKYQEAEEKLRAVLSEADRSFDAKRLEEFRKLQSDWEVYRDRDADFVSNKYAGGTIRPQIHARRLEYLTLHRIEEIKELVESERP